jgi:hypothetical protein
MPDNPVDYYCGVYAGDSSLPETLIEERKKDLDHEEEKAAG